VGAVRLAAAAARDALALLRPAACLGRHRWWPTERAEGYPTVPGLDVCLRDPRHTRRRPEERA
jgi:hypothetical protein